MAEAIAPEKRGLQTMRNISLEACLVLDNNFIVMLNEYFCEHHARMVAPDQLIAAIADWITNQFTVLKQFAADGHLHCTECVAKEFLPQAGRLRDYLNSRQLQHRDCRVLQNHVHGHLCLAHIDPEETETLKNLPHAPRRLINSTGLSHEDFSLIVRALQLAQDGVRVYILTDDHDLLSFVSWLKSAKPPDFCELLPYIEGWSGLHYLDLIHRSCRISTEQMTSFLKFAMMEHYKRTNLVGTTKGEFIFSNLLDLHGLITKSAQIKVSQRGVA
ncbi:MAG: hypothetical protein M5U01_09210 [Ardenticatenaceae bacterium]|nr:hypothetical protein [Ardenticatenaceae bacterium]HBY94184.1 hypothetical protein [Chloroflexota bacterium]